MFSNAKRIHHFSFTIYLFKKEVLLFDLLPYHITCKGGSVNINILQRKNAISKWKT